MGAKKKKRVQPQQTFQDMVASATLKKFAPYIQQQVMQVGQQLARQQQDTLETLYVRMLVIEDILMEKFQLSKDDLAALVSEKQDSSLGLEKADDVAEGDRVRLQLRTKMADQTEFQGVSRLMVDNAGSGNTLGKDIEAALIGMKTGEVKEITLTEANNTLVEITINRISRKPKVEETKAEENQGETDASTDEG